MVRRGSPYRHIGTASRPLWSAFPTRTRTSYLLSATVSHPNTTNWMLIEFPNDEDRAPARMALRELGSWMREEIRKHAEPPSNTEPVNAAEATQFLPIKLATTTPIGSHR